ncbi:MAG: hypothetical protein ACTHN5_22870 [Phycisphaerae bacterium]
MTRNDRTIRVLLITIVALLAGNLLVTMNNSAPRMAYAQGIPDTGAQLQGILDAVRDIGKKVDAVNATLQSGDITVKVKEEKK